MTKYDVIYLQDEGDPKLDAEIEITWCSDRVNDDDTKYVLVEKLAECQQDRDKEYANAHRWNSMSEAAEIDLGECEKQRDVLAEALGEILDCPYIIDEATVPKTGIDAAPKQVVGILSVSIVRIRKAQAVLASVHKQATQNTE